MVLYLANAFSLNMLDFNNKNELTIKIEKISEEMVKELLSKQDFVSVIGHESTAKFITEILGIEVPTNRIQIKVKKGDKIIVLQLLQRLPECKTLTKEELQQIPKRWFLVSIL